VAALLTSPTVAALAEEIDRTPEVGSGEAVAVWAAGLRPPWFCIQTDRRGMLALRNFIEPLGGDQPIYGLQAVDPSGAVWEVTTIGDLAPRCVAGIRQVQQEGPYFISGHSLGGLVAYEVACRLEAEGERVELMLLDTIAPAIFRVPQRARTRLAGMSELPPGDRVREVARLGARAARRLAGSDRRKHVGHVAARGFEGIIDIQEAKRLRRAYRPRPFGGRLLIFNTRQSVNLAGTETLGWDDVVSGAIETVPVPGDHLSMLIEPNVRELGRELAKQLRAKQAESEKPMEALTP
jgi:thioesterase domain-containing protein